VGSVITNTSYEVVYKHQRLRSCGFTLLELLVVLVIVGITLGAVSLKAMPSERQILQNDAQRIALLMQMARDEAILRNRPIAIEADTERYRFQYFEENDWHILKDDDLLREREFKHPPVSLTISPPVADQSSTLRIVFGREPVSVPFTLTLTAENVQARILSDGIGHFTVE